MQTLATASSVITVDLDKVERNIGRLRAHIGPKYDIMYVAKANGYGHGLITPTLFLAKHCGIQYISTSLLCEGLALRDAGYTGWLLVMGEVPYSGIRELLEQDMLATVYNIPYVRALSQEAVRQGKTAKLHVKIDTGLHRLGVRVGPQLEELMEEIKRLPNLEVEGAFTHLANAYDLDKTWTGNQTARFHQALDQLENMGVPIRIRHMANSAACVSSPETYFDLVRLAALVFGYDISPGVPNRIGLEPSMRWTSRIMHLLEVDAGESISYYNCYIAPKKMKVAIASFGAADGYLKNLLKERNEDNMYVLIRGKRARIIDLAFDQTFLDATDLDDIALDDEVVIVGRDGDEEITTMMIADQAGVSNGHICSSIGARPLRHYIYQGKPYVVQL